MECPSCLTKNPETRKFCRECGNKLLLICPQCSFENMPGDKFCGECGYNLSKSTDNATLKENVQNTQIYESPSEETIATSIPNEGERKHVTVLFSDLTGYTAMSEKLDPEELKKITKRIFGEISKVVIKYDGFIEKYVGDAVLAIFGVPLAHEDDPIRAVKAAREIHELVDAINLDIKISIGQPIAMHTGINTGLVVTGEVNLSRGVHGISGSTLNVASRICSVAKSGEILVSHEVFRQTFGHFTFENKGPIHVKGKEDPLLIYQVISTVEEPASLQHFSVLRSQLIGRKPEMRELVDTLVNLKNGKGRIFSILGEAGTGKSRLVEEFKQKVDFHEVQWFECHAFPYTQNIPYFPLMDLFNHLFSIEEEDPKETVRKKIESGITTLVGEENSIIPYVGSLYAIDYAQIADVSPEFWKAKLLEALKKILSAMALKSPTVFLLEDLQWVDPSFEVLLRKTLLEVREPAVVLCVYRPPFSLFTSHQIKGMERIYREIRLQPLSSSEAQDMLDSMLMTERIPQEVRDLVHEKAEGNPFYLEEMVNSLVESEILIRDGKNWKLTGPIKDSTISTTIHGIIAGRLDNLEMETKQVLQEASVIGRSFLYEILQRISTLKHGIDKYLVSLEQMDFIRTKSLPPDLEYMFKHVVTQEVVYKGLLISQRKEIHERIAKVMEKLFFDRLPECYESLAYHYSQGSSVLKAVAYLVRSGEKSHRRYSLEEAHTYFKEAYKLLYGIENRTKEENLQIIDLLIKWGYVFNCRADYRGLEELLKSNEILAQDTGDLEKLGMFYAWLGWSLRSREKLQEGYSYLIKSLQVGEKIVNQKVIGYACAWLSWTCADMGRLDEALNFGKRAKELIKLMQSDGEFVRFTLSGLGMTYYFRGDCTEARNIGEQLLRFGQSRSDLRCMAMGHNCIGFSHYVSGEHDQAIQRFLNAIHVSADTLFSSGARLLLGMTYIANEQLSEAEGTFEEIMQESVNHGVEFLGTAAKLFHGVIIISQGNLNKGRKIIEQSASTFLKSGSMYRYATANYTLGKVYARIASGQGEKSLSLLAKNIGFLMINIPLSSRKAVEYYNKAIEVARKIGAKGTLGVVCLELGILYKFRKKPDMAKTYISESIKLFSKCEAKSYLKKADSIMKSL